MTHFGSMRPRHLPLRIGLTAPNGRMGQAIAAAAEDDDAFVIDHDRADVLLDFSAPSALVAALDRATRANIPLLIGTTGLDDLAERRIADAARDVAILVAPNTSIGIAVLTELVTRASLALGDGWDAEIVEYHHRHKRDAPSGTALHLGQAVADGRKAKLTVGLERRGRDLVRQPDEIGFAVVRGGTIVGEHDVIFAGERERIVLSHRAEDRSIFARGALAGATFLFGREPGLYSMRDVVAAR